MTTTISDSGHDALASAPVTPEPPRPLRRDLPPAEPFPVDALGPVLGGAAVAVNDRIQAPMAICAQSVLGAAALAVQSHADVELPFGQSRPLSLYLVTVAASGERKTSADAEALRPVRAREEDLAAEHSAALARYDHELTAYDTAKRRIVGDRSIESQADMRAALAGLGPEPAAPMTPMLTAPEPTFEGLSRLFRSTPSLGLFATEGAEFVGGHGMSQDHRLRTAAGLSALWDGEPIRRVRAGDGASRLAGRRLSVHLMLQPGVAQELLGDASLADQGLLTRLLPVLPETTAGTRLWHEPQGVSAASLSGFESRLRALLRAPMPFRTDGDFELRPRSLPLSAAARREWIAFADHIETRLGPDGELEPVRAFAAKTAEHAARLGAVLQQIDDLHASELDEDHLAAGIILSQHYLAEWQRLHDAAAIRPEIVAAEKLLAWLTESWATPAVGLPEIYQRGPNSIRDARRAREVVAVLEEHGWLIRIDGGAQIGETFRRDAWRIVKADAI